MREWLIYYVSRPSSCIHVGTNDLVNNTGRILCERYKDMLSVVLRKRPGIQRIYGSLILPRCVNRRRGSCNVASVRHCNREACDFNSRLKQFCRRSRHVFFLDHALEWFPPRRVLAADGVHPSYEGVAVMATHIKYLALRHAPHASASACMLFLFDHCRHLSNSQANLQPMDRIYKGLLLVATRHRSPRGNDATQQKDFDRDRECDLERERDAEWWRLLVSGDLLRLRDLLFDFDFDLEWDLERDRLADREEARRFGAGLRERERDRDCDRERRLTGDLE
ncbi:hypothetical protein HPB50_009206 [Hyalomma asiaticum]|uniref:Uncharacterized protein n=1 Tax=Hyalomma asiaticum TaxID=266040 RepID=A0ACB7RSP4_HYAAI|nr:hypothetical protein HPB50_009206 [Hyalomma asiaticum]